MIGGIKNVGIALAIVVVAVGLVVSAGVALYLYADSEFTLCYGIFKSRAAAERAAEAGRDAGFDDAQVDHRADGSAVTFESGETGDDASESRRTFREIVTRERGTLGHPGDGCLERKPLEH